MIEIRGLTKRFGRKVVLDGLDLTVPRGKNTVVIGGSGTGKAGLIKCGGGALRAGAGGGRLDGGAGRLRHLTPEELGGGIKKRVGLARAIASEPEILL